MQDFAYLRRLYLTRRALLALERTKLMAQTPVTGNSLPDPADGFESVSDLASKLCQNAQQDYEVYIKIGYAVRRGVCARGDAVYGSCMQNVCHALQCYSMTHTCNEGSLSQEMHLSQAFCTDQPFQSLFHQISVHKVSSTG